MAIVTDLDAVNRDVTILMKQVYGERLAAIVLFGSYARGDFHEESDVDYLVVLTDNDVSAFKETSKVSPTLNEYYLATGVTLSVVATSETQLMESTKPFFKEVRKDKKLIYERRPAYVIY